jgi:hypothetical protein
MARNRDRGPGRFGLGSRASVAVDRESYTLGWKQRCRDAMGRVQSHFRLRLAALWKKSLFRLFSNGSSQRALLYRHIAAVERQMNVRQQPADRICNRVWTAARISYCSPDETSTRCMEEMPCVKASPVRVIGVFGI